MMLISFYISTLDVIWHGLNHPVGFPYRYAFYFSFLLLHIAYKGFLVFREKMEIKKYAVFAGIFLLYSIYLTISNRRALVFRSILFDFVLLLILFVFIYGIIYKKWPQSIFLYAILMIQIVDLSQNAITSVNS